MKFFKETAVCIFDEKSAECPVFERREIHFIFENHMLRVGFISHAPYEDMRF